MSYKPKILDVPAGGSGANTLTGALIGNGTSAFTAVAAGTAGNVLTSNGSTWTSSSPAAGNIITITGSLTNSQIKNLNATPIQVLPAPGVGRAYFIQFSVGKLVYGGTSAFTASAGQRVQWYYSTTITTNANLLGNSSIIGTSSRYDITTMTNSLNILSTVENLPLFLYNSTATEISGNAENNNTISYSLTYQIVQI